VDECKAAQRMYVVEILLNQLSNLPIVWQVIRIQPEICKKMLCGFEFVAVGFVPFQ
jgi:hypothetical protein